MEKEFDLNIHLDFSEEELRGIDITSDYINESLADALRDIADMVGDGYTQGYGSPTDCSWYLRKRE